MSRDAVVIARFDTPLGLVELRVTGGDAVSVEVRAVNSMPELPPGQRVDAAARFDARITANAPDVCPVFAFGVEGERDFSPESGQFLEAAVLEKGFARLGLGVRDVEWMLSRGVALGRLPPAFRSASADPGDPRWLVQYTPDGLRVSTGPLAPGETIDCPFAVAFVTAVADDDVSTWFAVDMMLP